MKQFWLQFLEVVSRHPNAIAIEDQGRAITYAALAGAAAALGEGLKAKGVKPETPVALELEKSAEYIAAMLGCWYAGAAFVPIPPSLPQERRDYMMRHADIAHTITAYDFKDVWDYSGPVQPTVVNENTLAYIIYTSGSTGVPKGVMVEHQGIINFIDAQIEAFALSHGSRYLFYLSILFDAAISDIGVTLLSGSTLVIVPQDVLQDGAKFVNALNDLSITHMDIPPSMLKTLRVEGMPKSMSTIVIGGEICPPDVVRHWGKTFRIVNVYGPTEFTVCTSLCVCDSINWQEPLLGDPIPNVEYIVLDEDELYIGGTGIARGYLKQPDLTAMKFIQHNNRRLYKTGDKVKCRADGQLVFLGRIDRQFKLRGQLVEPDEIEARLLGHPLVKRAAVMKRDEKLVAFISAHEEANVAAIGTYLKKYLPSWMIPQHFEFMQQWPLTATGKTDYAALRAATLTKAAVKSHIPPTTSIEKKIWNIWHDILKHDDFGITDDFFSVGGDSLGIIRMTLEAERQGLSISFSAGRTIIDLIQNQSPALSCDWLRQDVGFEAEYFNAAQARQYLPKTPPKNILLTGAAGFLGGNLLQELLKNTTADIYCLVRAESDAAAVARLKKKCVDPRIKPLRGDLEQPKLGLKDNIWQTLSETIDSVYHCAAKVNIVLSYHDLRNANVAATREILDFCLAGRRKHLHYASTLSVFVATDQNNGRILETDRLENTKLVWGGYAQTKWAAEWMLLQVPKDACAITHYRFGLITGDTKKGIAPEADFLAMFSRGVISLKEVPEGFDNSLFVDITPVDHAAAVMAHLSLHGQKEIYHIANPQGLSLGRLLGSIERKSGINIKCVAYWNRGAAKTVEEKASVLALCRTSPEEFKKHRDMDLFQATGVTFDMTNANMDCTMRCPEPSNDLLDLYMASIFAPDK